MNSNIIMVIDQGTTSSRAVLYDKDFNVINISQKEIYLKYQENNSILVDANKIYESVLFVMDEVLNKSELSYKDISGIGITNQRETTVIWDKITKQPVDDAIVWQSRHTEYICKDYINKKELIYKKTGLELDPYFSASKIIDILNTHKYYSNMLFGTIDSWLLFKLTGGKEHKTDKTNASRTMLYNIHDNKWDDELLDLFKIPKDILPEVEDNNKIFGYTSLEITNGVEIPICTMIGDQQSAMFGQMCFEKGMLKSTFGTGNFILLNTEDEIINNSKGLLSTILWSLDSNVTYGLEGSVFVAGSAVQWLRDGLKIINDAQESEEKALIANQDSEVILVPAFTGLGTPYWRSDVKGSIFGLTRDTTDNELCMATLQSICYGVHDIIGIMQQYINIDDLKIFVDGGAVENNYLLDFLSSILQKEIYRPSNIEATSLGAGLMTYLTLNKEVKLKDLEKFKKIDNIFQPTLDQQKVEILLHRWSSAVNAAIAYHNNLK